MVVSRIRVRRQVADTTASVAADFGVTREIGTRTPYDLTQRWAVAIHGARHGGLRYWPRFSLGGRQLAPAVFGRAGADEGRRSDPHPIDGWTAASAAGVIVVGAPRTLPTIEPPGPA